MPAAKTEVTEIVTGLGMLGLDSPAAAVASRPPEMRNVSDAVWERLAESLADRRLPLVVEWKGPTRAPGDEVVPADLRIDHVYLVSCKYLSRILHNASPAHL